MGAELVWDPFGDLEPRCVPAPPQSAIKPKEEQHRRAPIKNRRVLSFGNSDGEEDEDELAGAMVPKGKSAHDLLNDPKLLRDAAYPERKAQGGITKKRTAPEESANDVKVNPRRTV